MKKILYIPTSTLNFNNILSNESMSPESFYSKRHFGYSRWNNVEFTAGINSITLYDNLQSFPIENQEQEEHPLVIEIAINTEELKNMGNGIFLCDHSIYLDPWNAHFIFFSERDMKITLSISEASLETKLISLYRKGMRVEHPSNTYQPLYGKIEDVQLNKQAIEYDFKINRIKGLLYGYYIGANMSIPQSQVNKRNDIQELKNILSSILSSENHKPSQLQAERLTLLRGTTWEFLDKEEIENGRLLERVNQINLTFSHNIPQLYPNDSEIVVLDGHIASIKAIADERVQALYIEIMDMLFNFSSSNYNGKVHPFQNDLSDDITRTAKQVYGDSWESCEAKRFLNNLRRYVRGSSFTESWNNGLLSSIAAVITHGDDWHNLLQFMQSKGMYDYRIAFSLYGVLNGFANLTRDFTDIFLQQSPSYVSDVYSEFYGQLFGKPIDKSFVWPVVKQVVSDPNPTYKGMHLQGTNLLKKIKDFRSQFSLSKDQERSLNKAISENGNNGDSSQFISLIKRKKGWSRGKKLDALKLQLSELEEKINTENLGTQPTFWDAPQAKVNYSGEMASKSMLSDQAWWQTTAKMITDEKSREKYLTDVEWFVENHKENYIDPRGNGHCKGFYFNHDTSNVRVIERFRKYLDNKLHPKNPNGKWLIPYYQKVPIDNIISYLKKVYE